MKKILPILILAGLSLSALLLTSQKQVNNELGGKVRFWKIQSIDTVKYSRDVAGQFLNDPSYDKEIEKQVKAVASTGATHIAIGTPYDAKFVPFLTRWVTISRKYGLKIWFRGNFSGWEKWFDYGPITREEHKAMLKKFILDNGNLFQDGDVFTSCTECENGGPGDPRQNGDVAGHRQFLIDEYQIGKTAFRQIGKNVENNYFPMNGDVARLIMDKETTQALGGVVTVDHYVRTPEELNKGINDLAESSGGKVVLGEFGAPIPDLQGNLSETDQAIWIKNAMTLLAKNRNLIAVNYWTSFGGSTQIWNNDGTERQAVSIVKSFYSPKSFAGIVVNEAGKDIAGATINSPEIAEVTDNLGRFNIPYDTESVSVEVGATGYSSVKVASPIDRSSVKVMLKKQVESPVFKFQKLIYNLFKR